MGFSFANRDQLGNIVVIETGTKTELARFGPVWLGSRRRENFIQSGPQRGVDHFFERLAQSGRAFLRLRGYIGVQCQRGSHAGIMMPAR